MRLDELKAKNATELKDALETLRATFFELRMKNKTRQLKETADLKKTRHAIARAFTLLRLREIGEQGKQASE